MAEGVQFETDEFLKLLTDALRAGPGSPQWHDAVMRLRNSTLADADEYRMLITAREHLESGRDYRSIHAGPGFTRKVMDQIDQEAAGRKAVGPSANMLAVIGGVVLLAAVALIVAIIVRSAPPGGPTVDDLRQMIFSRTITTAEFTGGIPADWRAFGLEPTIGPRGLRGGVLKGNEKEYKAGGIYLAKPLPAGDAFAVESAVHLASPGNRVDLQLFISEDPALQLPQDFVVDVKNGEVAAYRPEGKLAGEVVKLPRGDVQVLIKLDRQHVIVEAGGKTIYAGPHGLSPDKPRHPGIRFLTRGHESDEVTVQSIRILKP